MAEGGATQSPETVVHAVREHTKHCSVQNSCIRHTLFLLHGLTTYIVHVYMCIHVQCIHVQCIHVNMYSAYVLVYSYTRTFTRTLYIHGNTGTCTCMYVHACTYM